MSLFTIILAVTLLDIRRIRADFSLFPNGTQSSVTISPGCSLALNANIECDTYIQNLFWSDYYGSLNSSTLQDSICNATCGSSLASYHAAVSQACSNDPQPWDGTPAVWAGDAMWATFNKTCLTDPSTGLYCVDSISSWTTSLTADTSILSLPSNELCSKCFISFLNYSVGTPYSNYDDSLASDWEAVQKTCGVGPFPTAVQPPVTNITALPGVSTLSSNASCLSGNYYTAVSGDNCQTIAVSLKVSTGSLMILNGIFPDCSNLDAGQTLCLPRACTIYLVQPNDNCASIASTHGITAMQLISFNPTLNSDCSNLLAGTNICVSQSGPTYTPTSIPGATATQTNAYATTTIAAPGPTPFGTTADCGKYYQVATGDNCQQISLNHTVTIQLFQAINPSINTGCTNLTPGLYYCVWPTADWNATALNSTATSAFVTAPAPTPSGSDPTCYEWHTVVTGDTCSLLESLYGISFDQLQTWNPQLDTACDNLLLSEAYCVNAPLPATRISSSALQTG